MDMESNDISQSQRKGPFLGKKGPNNIAVSPHACLLQVAFYVKARLCRSFPLRDKCHDHDTKTKQLQG